MDYSNPNHRDDDNDDSGSDGATHHRNGPRPNRTRAAVDPEQLAKQMRTALAMLCDHFETALTALESPNLRDPAAATLADAVTEVCLFTDTAVANYAKALAAQPELPKTLEYPSPTALLQHELGLKSRRAQDAVTVGRLLHDRRYPTLAAAVDDQAVSISQAAQIVRTIDDVADGYDPELVRQAEAAITDFATGGDDLLPVKPEQLRTVLQSWFSQHAPDHIETDHESQWRRRACTVAVRDDGMIHLKALLPPESGAAVIEYLDAHASPRVRFTDLNDPNPTPADDDTGELTDTRTRAQKMADGLTRAFHTAAASIDAPTQGGAAPTLTITIPVEQLNKHADDLPALAELPRTGTHVPAHTAARVACDGVIQAAVTGTDGEVLYLGRTQRLFSPKQKQALALTYKSCAVGGCDIPARWCEAHHAIPWAHGGKTDLSDGVLVCNFHHHQIHQDNLTVEKPPGTARLRVRRRRPRHRQPSREHPDDPSSSRD